MVDPLKNIGIVILAAGRGKRMNASADTPKVLVPLLGKPLLSHLLENVKRSVVHTSPVVVIAPDLYVIREKIGPICEYAIQESQLGTGHAVVSAKPKLLKYDHVLVLYGDHPLVSARTIDALVVNHLESGADITLSTLHLPHFNDWYSFFESYGRVMRDARNYIVGIIENKEATESEQAITEVNPGYYIFKASWLWNALPKLKRENSQGEYYLTDLLELALKEGRVVREVPLEDPQEGIGINTQEQLALVERILTERNDERARQHTGQLRI